MRKLLTILIVFCLISWDLQAREYGDSAIFQGVLVKLDLLNPVLEVARSKGKLQTYELAVSVRLKNRYYPTLEGGYAFGKTGASGGDYKGNGGFIRAGLDINGLRSSAASPHALLVGLRVGTSIQNYDLLNVKTNSPFWNPDLLVDYRNNHGIDAWGEVLAGCNVNIASGFYMGWTVRLKLLFTRKAKGNGVTPYYIPGYGFRDNINWGVNYYIGWRI